MTKRDFIMWLLTMYGYSSQVKNQAYLDNYSEYLKDNIDFDDLKGVVSCEWDKQSLPPIKWLNERKRNKYEIVNDTVYWTITGKNERGSLYDFACLMSETLDEAILRLKKRGLEYVSNNRDEFMTAGF